MLLRISLIIAIVAALAVGVLNFVMVKQKIETVEQHRASEEQAKIETQAKLADTEKKLATTETDLKNTKETLVNTEAERDRALNEVNVQAKKAAELTTKLAATTAERDDAQAQLAAYKATGYTPPQILGFDKQFKDLRDSIETATVEKKLLAKKLNEVQAKYDKIAKQDWKPPVLPQHIRGKILVSDPKWEFVVINVGEEDGVVEDGEMLISREGRLVGKVSVRVVEKNRCIANVLPGWKREDVQIMEGDLALPAS